MRRSDPRALRAVAVAVAVVLAAECGDSGGSGDVATPSDQTAASSTPTPGQSAEVVTNDGARLRITMAVGDIPVDGQADDVCATAPEGEGQTPVSLTVRNLTDRSAPFPPLVLETVAADGARQPTLVRAGAGECSAFPRTSPLGPGETAVFTGSTPAGEGRIEVRISETDFVLTVARP